jgi:RHS repeat-associated protein
VQREAAQELPAQAEISYDGRGFLSRSTFTTFPGTPGGERHITTATYDSDGVLMRHRSERQATATAPRDQPRVVQDTAVFYFDGRPVATLELRTETPPGEPAVTEEKLLFLTTGWLGSPILATDGAGNEHWSGGFEPFGGDSLGAGDAGIFLRLPGQWQDPSWEGLDPTGDFYYNVMRWYRPEEGRYLTRDPLSSVERGYAPLAATGFRSPPIRYQRGDPNLYLYAQNNPSTLVDPTGLTAKKPGGGPYHPPPGVEIKCRPDDDCGTLAGKMWILNRMITSHTGWDRHMPSPRGGGRHAVEISDLWRAYARCQALYLAKCQQPKPAPVCQRAPRPVPVTAPPGDNTALRTGVAIGATVGLGYLTYRVIRMTPSLFPPLWPTIPANLAIP